MNRTLSVRRMRHKGFALRLIAWAIANGTVASLIADCAQWSLERAQV